MLCCFDTSLQSPILRTLYCLLLGGWQGEVDCNEIGTHSRRAGLSSVPYSGSITKPHKRQLAEILLAIPQLLCLVTTTNVVVVVVVVVVVSK